MFIGPRHDEPDAAFIGRGRDGDIAGAVKRSIRVIAAREAAGDPGQLLRAGKLAVVGVSEVEGILIVGHAGEHLAPAHEAAATSAIDELQPLPVMAEQTLIGLQVPEVMHPHVRREI